MRDFIFFMHDDAPPGVSDLDWGGYLERLKGLGVFQGGSAIGEGVCLRKFGSAPPVTGDIGGYIRVIAESLEAAQALLPGNPVYEAGGTVEIRELPRN